MKFEINGEEIEIKIFDPDDDMLNIKDTKEVEEIEQL